MSDKAKLIIGTRGSPLARWQAGFVEAELRRAHPRLTVEQKIIKTKGDKILDVPLAKVGGKGLFVKELEEALLRGEVDLAVHSMKDVPAELERGLAIEAIMRRESPFDALISRAGKLDELPVGAVVGTSSLRRSSQLKLRRPDLRIENLRGNVDTRLNKLDMGKFAAIVLACAGLSRLGLAGRITEVLGSEVMLPAVGQGALGIETRSSDAEVSSLIAALHDEETAVCVRAERAVLRRLGGGCQVPIAAHARLIGGTENEELAAKILSRGGEQILAAVREGGCPSGDPE